MAYNLRKRKLRNYAGAAYKAASAAYKVGKMMRGKKRKVTDRGGITNQHDTKVIYRKKFMPRRQRRQWASFSRKVKAVIDKNLSVQTVLRNNQLFLTRTDTGPGGQGYCAVHLYGSFGVNVTNPGATVEAGCDDLSAIANQDGRLTSYSTKGAFVNAVLDLSMRNVSDLPLEVDVYDIEYYRDNVNESYIVDQGVSESTTSVIGSGGGIVLTDRGATPFDFPTHLRRGLRILKKTKHFIAGAGCVTHQIRDPKRHWFSPLMVNGSADVITYKKTKYAIRGLTRSVVLVTKALPFQGEFVWQLNIGATRSYKYVVMEDNEVKDVKL